MTSARGKTMVLTVAPGVTVVNFQQVDLAPGHVVMRQGESGGVLLLIVRPGRFGYAFVNRGFLETLREEPLDAVVIQQPREHRPWGVRYGKVAVFRDLDEKKTIHVQNAEGHGIIVQRVEDDVLVGVISPSARSNAFLKTSIFTLRSRVEREAGVYFFAAAMAVVPGIAGYLGGLTRKQVRGHFLINGGDIDHLIS